MKIRSFKIPLCAEHAAQLAQVFKHLRHGKWDSVPRWESNLVFEHTPLALVLDGQIAWLETAADALYFPRSESIQKNGLAGDRIPTGDYEEFSIAARLNENSFLGFVGGYGQGEGVFRPWILSYADGKASVRLGKGEVTLPSRPEIIRLSPDETRAWLSLEVDAGAYANIDAFITVGLHYELDLKQLTLQFVDTDENADAARELAESKATLPFLALNRSDLLFNVGKSPDPLAGFLSFKKSWGKIVCDQFPFKLPIHSAARRLNAGYFNYGYFIRGKFSHGQALIIDLLDGENYRIHHLTELTGPDSR